MPRVVGPHGAAHGDQRRQESQVYAVAARVRAVVLGRIKAIESRLYSYSVLNNAATNQLLTYAEIEGKVRWAGIAKEAVCRECWGHIPMLVEMNADKSPKSTPLGHIFEL